ncbi:MAG: CRISPR-associated helicase Cas3' [Oscillospiraceae bacterium]|nr:CRISPR-associated helicase Cas3' [Oscillospiraceae bacterium]
MIFPAHIREGISGMEIQTSAEHSRNSAQYASKCLENVGLKYTGYLLGLVHDCGKFKKEFEEYLMNPHGVRGSVNHTFAGTRLLMERYHLQEDGMQCFAAELLAFAVGSHHGLFDCVGQDRRSGFLHRMTKEDIGYTESKQNFLKHCTSEKELDELFAQSVRELSEVCERLADEKQEEIDVAEYSFHISLLARLLLSALIEADRRDTAEFMGGLVYSESLEDMHCFWSPYLNRVEEKLSRFLADTPIRQARRKISDRCRAYAEHPGGIFRLNVPTGGGKTLSSLRYALAHAKKWGKKRLIFTSPLLSILEQNAAVIREYLGDDDIILEHHSNVLNTEEGWKLDQRELAVESWNAPVIITTLVQLLNTLFEGKTTSVRRFQGLCNSVIVIDEVQTVPPRMLTLFNLSMDFLANVCGATILLCSATQPCLEKTDHPIRSNIRDVIPYDRYLWEPFRRTVITDAGSKTLEEIASFSQEVLEQVQSLLIVCNRKDEAEYLFLQLQNYADISCHLSAAMCTAHRRSVLEKLNRALAEGKKCLCVATQVIEAGVDISFQRVIRMTAGMDNVIQAAGRCNRHGESVELAPVYVVSCVGENLGKLREIKEAKKATESLLYMYHREPERFGNDLSSDPAIHAYYQRLYANMPKEYQDYYLEKHGATMFDLLSCNTKYCDEDTACAGQFCLNQAFKLAGSQFEVFDSGTRDVIVPYGEGEKQIAELTSQAHPDPIFLAKWERRARPYSVAVYEWQLKKLGNAVTEYAGVAILATGYYDEDTGLCLVQKQNDFLEV